MGRAQGRGAAARGCTDRLNGPGPVAPLLARADQVARATRLVSARSAALATSPGAQDVLQHDLAGPARVPGGQRLHQRLVLGHRLGPALGRHQRRVAAAAGLRHQGRVRRLERRIARRSDDAQVDLLVEAEIVGSPARSVVPDHPLVQRLQPCQLALRHAQARKLGRMALEPADDLEELEDGLGCQPGDAGAAPRQQLDQPLGGELLQRLADRRARHVEHLGQALLVEPASRPDLALDDHVPEPVAHLGVQQPASDRRAARAQRPARRCGCCRLLEGHRRVLTGADPLGWSFIEQRIWSYAYSVCKTHNPVSGKRSCCQQLRDYGLLARRLPEPSRKHMLSSVPIGTGQQNSAHGRASRGRERSDAKNEILSAARMVVGRVGRCADIGAGAAGAAWHGPGGRCLGRQLYAAAPRARAPTSRPRT